MNSREKCFSKQTHENDCFFLLDVTVCKVAKIVFKPHSVCYHVFYPLLKTAFFYFIKP